MLKLVAALPPQKEEEIKRKLSEILSAREFADKNKQISPFEIFWDKIKEFFKSIWKKMDIGEKLEDAFGNIRITEDAMYFLKILTIALMVVAIVLIVYFIARKYTQPRKLRQREDALLIEKLKDHEEVYKMACQCYDKGDYSQGLRFLYISMLIRLNELNIIRINKAKTNRQYLYEIRDNRSDFYSSMNDFTQAFNRHWYGGRKADKSIFDMWNNTYCSLHNLIRTR